MSLRKSLRSSVSLFVKEEGNITCFADLNEVVFLKLYDTASDNISAVSGRELSAHPYWPPLPASCAECWPSL